MMAEPSFFGVAKSLTISEAAKLTGSQLSGIGSFDQKIVHVGPIECAQSGVLAFIDNSRYQKYLSTTGASAVICSAKYVEQLPKSCIALINTQPYHAFGKVISALYPRALRPEPVSGETGISPKAFIGKGACIEPDVIIEPGAVIGHGAMIGRGSRILAGAVLGANICIGRDCTIGINASISHSLIGNRVTVHPNATIGQDGFGYAIGTSSHMKIPQIGRVIIQDDVDIGAGTAVDRGTNRDTIIGEGTKIDNHVMIGHNCQIGRHCIIVAMSGIAGSATLGDYVVLAAKVGIIGHVKIGDAAVIGAYSAIYRDVAAGTRWSGIPARPMRQWIRHTLEIEKESKNR